MKTFFLSCMLLFASSCDVTCEASEVGNCAYGHKCKKVKGEDSYSYFPDSSCSPTEGPPAKDGKKVYCATWRGDQCTMPVEVSAGDDDLVREPGQPKPPGWEPLPPIAPRPPRQVEFVKECRTEFGWPCGN